jgi:hypothetical protein
MNADKNKGVIRVHRRSSAPIMIFSPLLTVAARIGAARVSERFPYTIVTF